MKRTHRPDLTAAEATRVGEELREARLTLGASVEDMAEHLRINRRYIHALEEGRVKDLPGTAYAVGFVRSYSTALGLDPDDAVRRFRDVTGGAGPKPGELVFPEPVPSRGMPAGALVAVGVAVAIGAYVAWYNWSGSGNRVVDAVPPLPPRLEQTAQEAQRQRAGAADGSQPAAQAATPAATPTQAAAAVAPPMPTLAPATTAAPPPVAMPDGIRVLIRARGESWVQVRDGRANQTLLDRVLRNGDTFPVPNRDGLVLATGKAENLDIVVDGQPAPVLVGATGVRRGVVLDAERLRAALAGPAEGAAAPAAPAASARPAGQVQPPAQTQAPARP